MHNRAAHLRDRLVDNCPTLGLVLTLADPTISELMASAGAHWIWLDREHARLSHSQILNHIRAAQSVSPDIACLVRVSEDSKREIDLALGAGATGIIVPGVSTSDQARRIVESSYFAPAGSRTYRATRSQSYGLSTQEEKPFLALQIETAQGLESVSEIAKVKGIDSLIIGPVDLSAALGVPFELDHTEVRKAVGKIAACCHENRIHCGMFAVTPKHIQWCQKDGINLQARGNDIKIATKAFLQKVT